MKKHRNEMKEKWDDIKNDDFFKVPDGYFEKLPVVIQSRVSGEEKSPSGIWIPVLKWSIPALLLLFMVYFALKPSTEPDSNQMVIAADVSDEEIWNYLEESELSASEIVMETVDYEDLDALLAAPTVAEEYQLEEDLLFDLDWFESEDVYENI